MQMKSNFIYKIKNLQKNLFLFIYAQMRSKSSKIRILNLFSLINKMLRNRKFGVKIFDQEKKIYTINRRLEKGFERNALFLKFKCLVC